MRIKIELTQNDQGNWDYIGKLFDKFDNNIKTISSLNPGITSQERKEVLSKIFNFLLA